MKRVLIMNDFVSGGGAEVVMKNIVARLHNDYKITVMTMHDDINAFKEIFPDNVEYMPSKIKANSYRRINPLCYVISIYNRIRELIICSKKYDVVIANKEGPCMKLVSKMKVGTKLAWVHVDYRYLYWTRFTFPAHAEVRCMKSFDKVVCVSQAVADSIKEVIGDPGNLCVKYNPIDYCDIIEKSKEEAEVSRDNSKPLFVAVGRIVEQKNFITLTKVCSRLCKEFEFELWIVGDGKERKAIENILKNKKCSCVKILGMQSNPYKFLKQADFLVNTSLGESYGLVIQEALILGIPVLSTRCPAVDECFDSRFGILVDCNEEAIENAMRYVLENPECISNYKKTIKSEFDMESLWNQRLDEIERLIR